MEKKNVCKMECEYDYNSDSNCFHNHPAKCVFVIKRDTAIEYRIHMHNISWKEMPFRYEVTEAYRKNSDNTSDHLTTPEQLADIHPFKNKTRDGLAPARLSPHHVVSNNMGLGGEEGSWVKGVIFPSPRCPHKAETRFHTEWHIEC